MTVILGPHRWLELRRFRGLLRSGAMSLSEIARAMGLDRKMVREGCMAVTRRAPP
ncbi:hypothetical protein AB0420_37470 [Streptomyces caelestis]|uniref:Transcriptional regulator n=1 Tax=Streptomyces heliomycini TaxID=284032 RepID=A0ABV5LH91_9ACTN|nr:hypothetical protein [Streptomyces sp. XY152]